MPVIVSPLADRSFALPAIEPRMAGDDLELPQEVAFRLAVAGGENPALGLSVVS